MWPRRARRPVSPRKSLGDSAQTSAASDDDALHLGPVCPEALARRERERARWARGLEAGLERPALGPPAGEAAVEHGDARDPRRDEEPPQPGRPLADRRVVDDDGDAVVDAEVAGGPLESRRVGPREGVGPLRIGELLEQVAEDRAGDVALDEVLVEAAQPAETGRRLRSEHARVDDHEPGVAQVCGQPVGGDEIGREVESRHADTLVRRSAPRAGCRNRP
jgi:hypothetical protein